MILRAKHLKRLSSETFDALIIGGGINGAVSSAALSSRGAKVALIDERDFAGFTSQHSSNLIWGGIKYLESYEFSLVMGLCKARNTLLTHYPSTVKELRFLATLPQNFRQHPRMVWAGTWLYWLMGRRFTQKPSYLSPKQIKATEPAVNVSECRGGVEYSDAYLEDNDARFVFGFIRDAMDRGSALANYVSASEASFHDGLWSVSAEDKLDGSQFTIKSRVIVNAAGAFVDSVNQGNGIQTKYQHVFSKGIHLIVPKITQCDRVLAFIADDGRLFFAIPMGDRTCIGTTDTRISDPYTYVTEDDRGFVLNNINARLEMDAPLAREDIIAERCGVRPLAIKAGANSAVDFLQLSRKHVVEKSETLPYMSIFGGKLTDCINVGEEVCRKMASLGAEVDLTGQAKSPRWYGEPDAKHFDLYRERAKELGVDRIQLPQSKTSLMLHLWRRYGLDANQILDQIESDPAQVKPVIEGAGLFYCELSQLANKEMVTTLEDVLRRRTKLSLTTDREKLKESEGLMVLCQAVFGDLAQVKFDEYFEQKPA